LRYLRKHAARTRYARRAAGNRNGVPAKRVRRHQGSGKGDAKGVTEKLAELFERRTRQNWTAERKRSSALASTIRRGCVIVVDRRELAPEILSLAVETCNVDQGDVARVVIIAYSRLRAAAELERAVAS
jgi:hypothetical protein